MRLAPAHLNRCWRGAEPLPRACVPPKVEALLPSFIVALLFAATHATSRWTRRLGGTPRSVWLSAAGGISTAYVIVHVLPELGTHQAELSDAISGQGLFAILERHVYAAALAGLAAFYGLDRMLRLSRAQGGEHPPAIFWSHLGAFALYNLLIGYLLVHREDRSATGLALYAFALIVHFIVNDQALQAHHGDLYRRARWLLAAAPVLGWGLGVTTDLGTPVIALMFAFVAGAIILNVLKEELPEDRDSRFSAFAAGAGIYAVILLLL